MSDPIAEEDMLVLKKLITSIRSIRSRMNVSPGKRSNLFVRLLLEIPKRNFSFTQISRKTEKLVARLHEAPLEIANQSHDLEILPYEDTWEIILEELREK